MLLDRHIRRLDPPGEVKPVKKRLPYTICDIKDINAWRAEQRAKEIAFQEAKAARHGAITSKLQSSTNTGVIYEDKVTSPSETTKAYKQFASQQAASAAQQLKVCTEKLCHAPPEPWYSRIYYKILNFFLDLQY